MASFQAKIGWKRMRKREIKIIITFRSNPTRNRKFQKNSKNIQKIKKIPLCNLLKPKLVGKTQRKREKKNRHSVPFRSYPTRNRKFKKISKKIQKIKKYHYGFISSQNRFKNAEKEKI